jgi:hypothetical protein
METYIKKATDFLKKTKTTFKVEYLKTGKYFPDDKEERDIYNITLIHGPRSYSFTFGQSILESRKISRKMPNEYDVLACLTKHDPGTFEDFCFDFGYDTDSKKAEKTYNAVKDEYSSVCYLFSTDEIEEMQEIE